MPAGRDGAQTADHVVEAAVSGGILPRGAGGGEPADGGELEALREMAQREAVCAKQCLCLWSGHARAELGLTGHLVEAVQFVETGVGRARRRRRNLRAADRARPRRSVPPPNGNDGDPVFGALSQDRGDLVLGAREQHRVGRVLNS